MFAENSSRFVYVRQGECDHVSVPAVLALADGTDLPRPVDRSQGQHHRRSRFQYRAHRLPGNSHRPVLRASDRHAHLSAHRQHRHHARGSGVRAGLCRPVSSSAICRCCASNWRANESLPEFLERGRVVAIAGIDTRKLTRILREKGAQAGCIMTGEQVDEAAAVKAARKFPGLKGMDLAKVVSAKRAFQWNEGSVWPESGARADPLATAPARRRLRLRHQAQHPAAARRRRLPHDGGAGADQRRGRAGARARRRVPLERPGDPEPCDYAITATQEVPRDRPAGVRHLSRPPDPRTRRRRAHREDEVRPPRRQSPGAGPRVRAGCSSPARITASRSMRRRFRQRSRPTHRSLFDGSLQGIAFKDGRRSASRDTRRRVPDRTT